MQPAKSLWQNKWTISGAVLAVLATLFFISFQLIEVLEPVANPYMGIWTFLILPALLIIGLLLIPLGYLLERRKRRRLYPEVTEWPRLPHFDPNNPRHLRGMIIFVAGTVLVIPLIGMSSYEGYHYTDSTQFCGQVCHQVMRPEFTAYQNSPHARVTCAECHIGPGASWFVKSKISGVRQVLAVTFNTFSRPIPTPIENLRPARETCEQCHWPAKFYASQLRSRVHFLSDQHNTRSEIQVVVKTGGGDSSMGPASGIHWHMALNQQIEYVATDERRQVIPWVRSTEESGKVTIFRSDGKSASDPPPSGEMRVLDCMDCHNRPTHIYQPPDRAVNVGLETGRLDPRLPYIKKIAVEALTDSYSSDQEADRKIEATIRDYYRQPGGDRADPPAGAVDRAIREVQAIYHRSFFPDMKVDWRAYPDNIGHMIFDGCFRCHNGAHVSDDHLTIRKDCNVCHEFLEPISGSSARQSFREGVPDHPIELLGIHARIKCSSCHTGGRAPEASCAGCHTVERQFQEGKSPILPGLEPSPWVMVDVDCESCHDLSVPQTSANLGQQCEACHEQGYADWIGEWQNDASAGRVKAAAAIAELQKGLKTERVGTAEADRVVFQKLQAALEQVERAGPQHNAEFATAIYDRIIELAKSGAARAAGRRGQQS